MSKEVAIMKEALDLFIENGYDGTSVNSIIQKVNISKGGFYHYFSSKEDLLDRITQYYMDSNIGVIKKIIEDQAIDALEKLNRIFSEVLQNKVRLQEIGSNLYNIYTRPENLKFHTKLTEYSLKEGIPLYTLLLTQGIEEGLFHIKYPELTAELLIETIFQLSNKHIPALQSKDENDIKQKLVKWQDFYEDTIERILGLKKGSINLSEIKNI